MIAPRIPNDWLCELWHSAPSLEVVAELTGYALATLRRKRQRLALPRLPRALRQDQPLLWQAQTPALLEA